MGCKPSKEAQVATGNTVNSAPNLQEKKSNVSKKLKSEEITSTVIPLPTNKTDDAKVETVKDNDGNEDEIQERESERERVQEIKNVSVKDVQENNNKEEETVERRTNVIAPDSPDQFFSTRKDEVPVVILTVPLMENLEADDAPEDDFLVEKFEAEDEEMKKEKEENDVKDMKNVKDNDDIEEKKEEIKEEKEVGSEKVEEIKNDSVEDVQENNNNIEETKERSNVIAPDSPDQFFSTRKDEVPVEILTVPSVEKLEADDVPENNALVEEVKAEDQEMKEEKEGPSCSKDSADLKETVLVKEDQ